MGIPAIQFEVPRSMRDKLVKDEKLFDGFCKAIADGYKMIEQAFKKKGGNGKLSLDPKKAYYCTEVPLKGNKDFKNLAR